MTFEYTKTAEQRYLFCCESVYQLLNAIVIRKTLYPDAEADLVLSDHTDFTVITENLKREGIFDNVYNVEIVVKNREFYSIPLEKRCAVFECPELYWQFPTPNEYTDFFIPIDHVYWKCLYYIKLGQGYKINIHLFEEGLRAYTMDIFGAEEKETFNTGYYGKQSFASSICEMLLYEPSLYSVPSCTTPIKQIPKMTKKHAEVLHLITQVFPCDDFPQEKYIFFEESYIGDGKLANDFRLFEEIVRIVGRDNIIVKRHPRNKIDRFTPKGYKVMANWKSPWEAQLAESDISDKVFITVSSTASVTSFLLFDKKVVAIHLLKQFNGDSPLLEDQAFTKCYNKMLDKCNRSGMCVYSPTCMEEVEEIINYYRDGRRAGRHVR